MSGLFGGGVKSNVPRLSSMQISTSVLAKPIPIVYGRQRVAVNLLDYTDFWSVAQQSSGGGKGGGKQTTGYTYYANLLFALCEGPVSAVLSVWSGKTKYPAGTTSTVTLPFNESYQVNATTSAFNTQNIPIAATYTLTAWISDTGVRAGGAGQPYTLVEGTDFTHIGGTTGFTIQPAFWTKLSATGLFTQQTVIGITYGFAVGIGASPLANIQGTFFNGAAGQSVWSWYAGRWSTTINGALRPGSAPAYNGICYVGALSMLLDSSGGLPNISLEIDSGFNFSPSIRDANPKDVVYDLLTNPRYGANFPFWKCADWTSFSNYCIASGTFLSMVLDTQTPAADILKQIGLLTTCDYAFTDGVLKITPYADATVTGNGATFTPNLTAAYALTYDNFITDGGQSKGPLVITRKSMTERFNQVIVKFRNRLNGYADDQAEAKDEADIGMRGLVPMQEVNAQEIADPQVARNVAQMILQRAIAKSTTFTFTLPFSFCLLEPMDLVTLTDPRHSLVSKLVRITEITENKHGDLNITAEDVPFGHATAIANPTQTPLGYTINYSAPPGSVSPPVIFDAPGQMTNSGYEVWCAVAGLGSLWGACQVYLSTDGTTYKQVGTTRAARYGSLYASVPAGTDPDTTDTFSVDLTTSGAALTGGSTNDADLSNTLCWVDGELIAYSTANLVSTSKYTLTGYTRRGIEGTPNAAHSNGAGFARLDANIFKLPYDPSLVGKTIYLKFPSVNIYGGGVENITTLPAYSYAIGGPIGAPANLTGLTATAGTDIVLLQWNPITTKNLAEYEIRMGSTWASATVVGRSRTTQFRAAPPAVGTTTYLVSAIDSSGRYSVTAASVNFTVSLPGTPAVSSSVSGANYVLTWAPVSSTFLLDHYEVRQGATWATATLLGTVAAGQSSLTYTAAARFGGSQTFLVAGVDVEGNIGAAGSAVVTVTGAPATTVNAQVIDNNVLLTWQAVAGVLPTASYEIRRGSTYAGASVVGTKSGLFTSLFETAANTYTYWVTAIDTAGNYGTPASVTATVNAPPDYVLKANYNSTFSGTLTNALLQSGALVMPVDLVTTFAAHFTTPGWAGPSAQVTAGDPIYIEPTPTTAAYDETIDYGTILASSKVSVTPTYVVNAGSPSLVTTITTYLFQNQTVTLTIATPGVVNWTAHGLADGQPISFATTGTLPTGLVAGTTYYVKTPLANSFNVAATPGGAAIAFSGAQSGTQTASDPGTVFTAGATQVYATNFRYFKVHLAVTGTGVDILTLTSLNIRLDVKLRSDGGSITWNGNPTTVTFAVPFINVTGITLTPMTNANIVAVTDFVSVANPTTFKVYLYTASTGAVPAGPITVGWQAKGY